MLIARAVKASETRFGQLMALKTEILYRYTTLPILLDVLHEKHITLLSPETWDDRNDAHYLEQYRKTNKLGSVLAVCFAAGGEKFHYWRVFSSGASGVRIEFDKERLLRSFAGLDGFRHQFVSYRLRVDVEKKKPETSSWPFLKRSAFRDEQEYRIIFETETEDLRAKSVPIDLASIRSLTLSPWLPSAVAPAVRRAIGGLDGCSNIKVRDSSLLENARWRAAIT
jgi:hypothetical protein